MAEPVVFVVGAGASCCYGLPVGSKLGEMICSGNILPSSLRVSSATDLSVVEREYRRFQQAFKKTRLPSIDRFLQNRPEFANIGKMTICHHLYRAEIECKKFSKDCWISWVFDRLVNSHGQNVRLWPVKFVTFNYDRVLEYFLAEMYANTFNSSFGNAYKRITEGLDIVHVYGKIPDLDANIQNPLPDLNFGMGDFSLSEMAKGIQVLGEERSGCWNNNVHRPALRLMKQASTIVFLGFSFDPENCSAIGLGENHDLSVKETGWYSSGFGLKKRERDDACNLTSGQMKFGGLETSCRDFLREHVSI